MIKTGKGGRFHRGVLVSQFTGKPPIGVGAIREPVGARRAQVTALAVNQKGTVTVSPPGFAMVGNSFLGAPRRRALSGNVPDHGDPR